MKQKMYFGEKMSCSNILLCTLLICICLFNYTNSFAQNFQEIVKVLASDSETEDYFGYSVSIVGAEFEDTDGVDAGAAYILYKDQGGIDNWGEVKKIQASDKEAGDRFGESVSISGDYIIVGASYESTGGSFAGAVYIFHKDQGGVDNWGEVKKIQASDKEANDQFGFRLSISGNYVIASSPGEDTGGSNVGAAYIFHKDQGGVDNWGEVKKIQASNKEANDQFGYDVSLSNDYAIVGAGFEDTGGLNTGSAYIFHKNQGGTDNWGEVKKIQASDIQASDFFGLRVSISGDYAIVGSKNEDTGGSKAGAAYIFYKDQGGSDNWGEIKKIQASDKQANDQFGGSVSISGSYAIIGAHWEDTGGNAAYVFYKDQGGVDNWGEVQKIEASDLEVNDFFGFSVSISDDSAIVGAFQEDSGGINAGAAYIFNCDTCSSSNGNSWSVADIVTDCDFDGGTYDVCYTAADLASVIGLDVNFSYPSQLTPVSENFITLKNLALNPVGGDASKIDVFSNTDIAGEVSVSVYFNSNAPLTAAWTGGGEFICFAFEISDTWDGTASSEIITTNELFESYDTSVSAKNAESATLEITTMNGQINVNGNETTPLSNSPSFTGTTEITTANENCTPNGQWTQSTIIDGVFSIPTGGSANLRITRNTNQTDLSVLNGTDALRAVFIRLGFGDSPTVNELLAMDVNGDGFASAGDITNILRRSVGLITDYPTQAGEVASDWKFALSSTIDGFEAEAAGIYEWKNVPVLPQCIAIPANPCDETVVYDAILKGDVVSSWTSGSNFKTAAERSLVIDIAAKHTLEMETTYRIPVYAKDSESFFTLDLDLSFDPSKVSIEDVVLTELGQSYDIQYVWNTPEEGRLMIASYTIQEIATNEPLFEIIVKEDVTGEEFGVGTSYFNGIASNVEVTDGTIVSIKDILNNSGNLTAIQNIHPNPAKNVVIISYSPHLIGDLQVQIIDLTGRIVTQHKIEDQEKATIDISMLQNGLYILTLSEDGELRGKTKLVVAK